MEAKVQHTLFFIGLLAVPQLLNVSHTEGLNPDFSNLLLSLALPDSEPYYADFSIVQFEPSAWAEVSFEAPEGNYSLSILANSTNNTDGNTTNSTNVNVTYFRGLSPDFSNLAIDILWSGGRWPAPFFLLEFSPSEWALAQVQVPPSDYSLEFFAADLPHGMGNSTNQSNSTNAFPLNQSVGNNTNQSNQSNTTDLFPPGNSTNQSNSPPVSNPPLNSSNQSNLTENLTLGNATNSTNETLPGSTNNSIQSLNVTFFEGLSPDFSNLEVQAISGNTTEPLEFGIVLFEPSSWALIAFSPPEGNYSLEFFADNSISNQSANSSSFNVTWFEGLEPDFSNLILEITGNDGEIRLGRYEIAAIENSSWASVAVSPELAEGESVEFFAADIPSPQENLNQSNATNITTSPHPIPFSRVVDGRPFSGDAPLSFESSVFDGAGALAALNNSSDYDFGTGDFSVAVWVKTASANEGTILHRGSYGDGGYYSLMMNGDGTVRFFFGNWDGDFSVESTTAVNDGKFHQLAAVRGQTYSALYIDGALAAFGEHAPISVSSGGFLSIGSNLHDYPWSQAVRQKFYGEIANPAIYPRSLASDEIAAMAAGGME